MKENPSIIDKMSNYLFNKDEKNSSEDRKNSIV